MKESKYYVFVTSLTVALGGFLLGFDASVISGVIKFIEPEFNLTKLQLGWAVGCITLTAVIGIMIAGPLSDKIGRKVILKWAAVLFTISAIGSALAPTFFLLIVARLVGGLAVGASLIIAPVYIAEVSPSPLRGQMVSLNQLNIVLGISIAFFTNYLILKLGESQAGWVLSFGFEKWNWRWMLGLETLPAIIYFIGLQFVPRSPRWLLMMGKDQEAHDVTAKFLSEEKAIKEVASIKSSISKEKNKEKLKVGELFKPAMRNVIVIGLVVGIFQQITGINSVLFFAPMIFEQTGIGTDASFIQAILVGLTNLVFTVIAIFTIDKLGRKPLLIIGMTGIAVCMLLMSYGFASATYTITDEALGQLPVEVRSQSLQPLIGEIFTDDVSFKRAINEALGAEEALKYESQLITATADINSMLILISILGFVGSFAVSIGPVMWVMFSELFPNRIRGLAISFVGLVNNAVAFTVQLIFPWELAQFGSATTFLIYGIFAVIGFLFIWTKVPETKGKTLEELEAELVK